MALPEVLAQTSVKWLSTNNNSGPRGWMAQRPKIEPNMNGK